MAVGRYGGRHVVAATVLLTALPCYRLSAQCPDGGAPPCRPAPAAPRPLDPRVVAVLPFRVVGTDTAYAEGVAELVAAEFTGEGAPRAADMGSVLRAWRRAGGGAGAPLAQDAAARIAAQVGAGRLVTGSVVGLRNRLTLTAVVTRVPDGLELGRTPPVQGPEDSLPELLRRLSANLLAVGAPDAIGRRREAATTSPEALRAYMAGRAAYRRGRFAEAAEYFVRTLAADSTYAPAAYALLVTSGWAVDADIPDFDFDRVQELAWRDRARLGDRDRTLLEANLGPRYPDHSTWAEILAAHQRAVMVAPDAPEAWYGLGDTYFHVGALLGVAEARRQSAEAFDRSLAIDTTVAVLSHQLELAVLESDARRVRSLWTTLARFATRTDFVRQADWLVGLVLHDTTLLRRARGAADSMSVVRLISTANVIQLAGLAPGDADSALALAARRATIAEEQQRLLVASVTAALNFGRPARAARLLDRGGEGILTDAFRLRVVLGGWEGDAVAAEGAAARLARLVDGPVPDDAADRRTFERATCWLSRWRLQAGDTTHGTTAVERLRAGDARSRSCADVVAALADARGLHGFGGASARFEAMLGSAQPFEVDPLVTLDVARARVALGDVAAGLAILRRRPYWNLVPPEGLAAALREEGRLAALTADTTGAVRAYRHYLVLRSDPEPSLVPQRDSVRAELARLEQR